MGSPQRREARGSRPSKVKFNYDHVLNIAIVPYGHSCGLLKLRHLGSEAIQLESDQGPHQLIAESVQRRAVLRSPFERV